MTFYGAKGKQKEFRISIEEFNSYEKGKIYSKGDNDVLCIEIAMVKYLKSLGVKIPDNGIQGLEVASLGKNELVGLLIGDNVQKYYICSDKVNVIKNGNYFLNECEKTNEVCALISFKNINDEIYNGHAYALKRIENKNGKKYIIFINPYNSTKELKMEYSKFINSVELITMYELNSNQKNRNLMQYIERKFEYDKICNIEKEMGIPDKVCRDQYGLRISGDEYQVFTSNIRCDKTDDLKQYINDLSDLQRYFMVKHDAKRYIDMLDNRYMGWSSENIQNKKDVIQLFINSTVEHAKLYGVSEKYINEFKNTCTEELNARFYTNQRKIIEAFEKFIKIFENAKEEYYN